MPEEMELSDSLVARHELLRRSHCASPEQFTKEHKCAGKLTVMPGMIMLDCSKCGASFQRIDSFTFMTIQELEDIEEGG